MHMGTIERILFWFIVHIPHIAVIVLILVLGAAAFWWMRK